MYCVGYLVSTLWLWTLIKFFKFFSLMANLRFLKEDKRLARFALNPRELLREHRLELEPSRAQWPSRLAFNNKFEVAD